MMKRILMCCIGWIACVTGMAQVNPVLGPGNVRKVTPTKTGLQLTTDDAFAEKLKPKL